jgi:hypothetical protein
VEMMHAQTKNQRITCSAPGPAITTWRFFQGLRQEWRWYRFDGVAQVTASSGRAFAELDACMKNAEHSGFRHSHYQVHMRSGFAFEQAALLRSTDAARISACGAYSPL